MSSNHGQSASLDNRIAVTFYVDPPAASNE